MKHGILALFLTTVFSSAGDIRTLVGTGTKGYSAHGVLARGAQLDNPFGITRGPDGMLYFCEFGGNVIRRISPGGELEIVAGIPGQHGYDGDGRAARQATFFQPHEIRFDAQGDLYVSDMSNHVIRKVDMKTMTVSTFAGIGRDKGFAGDGGPATKAKFADPISLQFGPDGDLYICDIGNNRLRKVDMKTGVVTTVCGNGMKRVPADGDPFSPDTPLHGPRTIEFDSDGNGWLALREGNTLFKIDMKAKKLIHVAGRGKQGNTGNGGPAKQATLSGPKGLAISPGGKKVFIADTESHTIRWIDLNTGVINVLVGTGKRADGPDGPALECGLARPHGVFADKDGSLYIGDSENHRLRVITP